MADYQEGVMPAGSIEEHAVGAQVSQSDALDEASLRRAVESVWEDIAENLRAESRWRSGRQDIEPLPRYQMCAPAQDCGNGAIVSLKAGFTRWEAKRNSAGHVYGQNHAGDVFEQAEAVITVGRNAVNSLLDGLPPFKNLGPCKMFEACWPDHRGEWRDGCHAEIELTIWNIRLFDDVSEQSTPHAADDAEAGDSESFLADVLGRIMAGNEVVKHTPGDLGDTHDLDLLAPDGRVIARVECVELTSEAAENLSQGGRDGGRREVERREDQLLGFYWEARITARNLGDSEWQAIDRDLEIRTALRSEIEEQLVDIAVWAETQMGTPPGVSYIAEERVRATAFSETVRPHLSATKTREGQTGELQTVYDGTSIGCSPNFCSNNNEVPTIGRLSEVISAKADKNQAGVHPEPKWLLIHINQIWAQSVALALEGCLAHPPMLSRLSDNTDLKCFDEVWTVWEIIGSSQQPESPVQATSVIIFTQGGLPPRHVIAADERITARLCPVCSEPRPQREPERHISAD